MSPSPGPVAPSPVTEAVDDILALCWDAAMGGADEPAIRARVTRLYLAAKIEAHEQDEPMFREVLSVLQASREDLQRRCDKDRAHDHPTLRTLRTTISVADDNHAALLDTLAKLREEAK